MQITRPLLRWLDTQPLPVSAELLAYCGSDFLANCLVRRGIDRPGQAGAFLDMHQYRPANPLDLPDLEKGAQRIWRAIQNHETIGVWGDFDVDGQTSTTLLVSVLRQLGGQVDYHIPVRARESHGVNLAGLKEFVARGVQVVLTCDTGITAFEAAEYCRAHTIDLVITDHHTLGETLPTAYAVINPQRLAEGHPLRTIPGVGTAYAFSQALCALAGRSELADQNLDLVALGTVADVATLVQDARYHVQKGLELLRAPQRMGLQKLYSLAEVDASQISEEQIGFLIGPRMNALGRLADANHIVDFLTTDDPQSAGVFAAQLEGLNAERKFLTDQVFKGALTQLEAEPELLQHPALILAHAEWPAGVIGIVASRLVELFSRPVILLTAPPGAPMHGSARSVDGVNVTSAIAAAKNHLLGFGGHPMAAGLSFSAEKFNTVRRKIWADVARQIEAQPYQMSLQIETYRNLKDIDFDLAEQIERLAPFGPGNPAPILATRNVRMIDCQPVGKKDEHLVVLVEDEDAQTRRLIWWNGEASLIPKEKFDLAYTLRANNFRGQTQLQLEWKAAREIVTETIAVQPRSRYQYVDLRLLPDPSQELEQYSPSTTQWWAEGLITPASAFPIHTRGQLEPAATLIVLTPPPDRAAIRAALAAVQPQTIVLANLCQPEDVAGVFLKQISGLVRFALANRDGRLDYLALAARTGQTLRTIQLGVEWLSARGVIRLVEQAATQATAAEGGVPNAPLAVELAALLQNNLAETAAFRSFYLRAAPEQVISYS